MPMKLTLSLLCWLDYDGGRHDLALVSVASGQIQTLVSFTEPPHTASLSPDDRFVVYDQPSDRAHDWDLFIVSTHGGPPSVLLQHPANDVRPFWISNGSAVAFTSDRSGAAAADLPSVRGLGTGWRPSIDGRQHPRVCMGPRPPDRSNRNSRRVRSLLARARCRAVGAAPLDAPARLKPRGKRPSLTLPALRGGSGTHSRHPAPNTPARSAETIILRSDPRRLDPAPCS
jgi:hypothetical protein